MTASQGRGPGRCRRYLADAVAARVVVIRQLPHAGVKLVAALVLVDLVLGVLPIGFVLATSVLIGRVPAAVSAGTGSAQWNSLVSAFLVASATFLAQQLLTPVQAALGERMKHRVDGHFHRRVIDVALRSTGIAPLEDQDVLDRMRQASESLERGFRTPGHATAGILAYLTRYSRLVGFCVLLGFVVAPWAAIAIFASTMLFRFGQRGPGLTVYMRLWPVLGPIRRERDYFRDLGWQASTAKEMRVFGLVEWAIGRFRGKADESLVPLWRERRRYMTYHFLWYTAVGLVIDCTVAALMVRSAALDHITLTQLALGMQAMIAAVLLGEHYHEADVNTQFGMQSARALNEFEALVLAHSDKDVRDTAATADAAGLPQRDIRFADVSFRYPAGNRPVYERFNLTLRAGECTALVGLNGAGKTTLVKLLARLYEPDGGALLVDGRDVRDFTVASWRRQIGVIFQDFTHYELSVADNIAFGAIERPVEADNIRAAAAKSGMTTTVDSLPLGFDTPLARQYEGGADLSGGQWQRIAIARALYAVDAGAKVLVLDEPTAALDARSEAGFFAEFASLTRGLTTLLISHRFSSVRQADRIVVVEHGRIIEDGTHESLVALGGRYAEMFRLQADRFAGAAGPDGGDR
ncbi:MAG: ATP-binding cassette, subfamily bacterial [Actinoplanes sp.]|nr:ATP-binding cassette, subfamily bacterial [Actinoplanes sp.]